MFRFGTWVRKLRHFINNFIFEKFVNRFETLVLPEQNSARDLWNSFVRSFVFWIVFKTKHPSLSTLDREWENREYFKQWANVYYNTCYHYIHLLVNNFHSNSLNCGLPEKSQKKMYGREQWIKNCNNWMCVRRFSAQNLQSHTAIGKERKKERKTWNEH